MIAYAAQADNLGELIGIIGEILALLVPLIIGLAVVAFLWGVLKFVIADSDKDGKKEGRMFMVWGIIAITIMVSVWGLVAILKNSFFEGARSPVNIPSNSSPNKPLPGGGGGGGW